MEPSLRGAPAIQKEDLPYVASPGRHVAAQAGQQGPVHTWHAPDPQVSKCNAHAFNTLDLSTPVYNARYLTKPRLYQHFFDGVPRERRQQVFL